MPELVHLPLLRADMPRPRRKKRGFGAGPARDEPSHGRAILGQIEAVLSWSGGTRLPAWIDPSLVLRVRTVGPVADDLWVSAGLTVLSDSSDGTVVLFASDHELRQFRSKVTAYARGIQPDRQSAANSGLVGAVELVDLLAPRDRIGPALQAAGFTELEDFQPDVSYRLDIEIWDLPTRELRIRQLDAIAELVRRADGEVGGRYVGESLTILRISVGGSVVRQILEMPDVANIDLPPTPDSETDQLVEMAAIEFGELLEPEADAVVIGVIDSGITGAHPLLSTAVAGATAVPLTLGAQDASGHGTKVAGVALYLDVRSCARDRSFQPSVRIASCRVVNQDNRFDDLQVVPAIMRLAITQLYDNYGVRVFNVSLCDPNRIYADGKISAWATVLDELARELDVLIVVAAGNRRQPIANTASPDDIIAQYPGYLLEAENRLFEPATAAIVLTVGAVAQQAGVPGWVGDDWHADVQPVANVDEPSPFTRRGPGIGGMLKPDLCDYGGNLLFNGGARNYSGNDGSIAVMTLSHEYVRGLFTFGSGTSLAAPRVAHKAAQILADRPAATANLLRALLASSASVPAATRQLFQPHAADSIVNVCGNGIADLARAKTSDDSRVVMFDESQLDFDHFHIYDVPIPPEFATTSGERKITVTLAFDPPVRHTRKEYLGTRMSFRLVRGRTVEQVIEFFRHRRNDEPLESVPPKFSCKFEPGSEARDVGTLQRGIFRMARNPNPEYGETYFLVVRCERKWALDEHGPQKFAVVVELEHASVANLYQRVEARVRPRVRPGP